jgi:hypothetical protein
MTDYRHHHAVRDVQVVLVPVPYEIGSPKEDRRGKPLPYPRQERSPWKPQRDIPATKAQRMGEFMRRVQQQTEDAREFMRQARQASQRRDEVIPSA